MQTVCNLHNIDAFHHAENAINANISRFSKLEIMNDFQNELHVSRENEIRLWRRCKSVRSGDASSEDMC